MANHTSQTQLRTIDERERIIVGKSQRVGPRFQTSLMFHVSKTINADIARTGRKSSSEALHDVMDAGENALYCRKYPPPAKWKIRLQRNFNESPDL